MNFKIIIQAVCFPFISSVMFGSSYLSGQVSILSQLQNCECIRDEGEEKFIFFVRSVLASGWDFFGIPNFLFCARSKNSEIRGIGTGIWNKFWVFTVFLPSGFWQIPGIRDFLSHVIFITRIRDFFLLSGFLSPVYGILSRFFTFGIPGDFLKSISKPSWELMCTEFVNFKRLVNRTGRFLLLNIL